MSTCRCSPRCSDMFLGAIAHVRFSIFYIFFSVICHEERGIRPCLVPFFLLSGVIFEGPLCVPLLMPSVLFCSVSSRGQSLLFFVFIREHTVV